MPVGVRALLSDFQMIYEKTTDSTLILHRSDEYDHVIRSLTV